MISLPPTRMKPSPASTVASSPPSTESCLSRCAIVAVSPRSFAATISKSPPCWSCARRKFRPIRPNPLIPTLIVAMCAMPFVEFSAASLARQHFRKIRRTPQTAVGISTDAGRSGPRPTCAGAARPGHATSQLPTPNPRASKAKRSRRAGGRTGKLRGRPSRSLHHTRDRGDGRGLNPPPDERGPAVVEYDDGLRAGLDELQIVNQRRAATSAPQPPVRGRLRRWRPAAGGELRESTPSGAAAATRASSRRSSGRPSSSSRRTASSCTCAARLVRTRFA